MAVLQEEGAAVGPRGGPAGGSGLLVEVRSPVRVEVLLGLIDLAGALAGTVEGTEGGVVAGAGAGAAGGGRRQLLHAGHRLEGLWEAVLQ